jgi:hypothetical protein
MSEIRKEIFVALIHRNSAAHVLQVAVLLRRYVLFILWRDLRCEVVSETGWELAQLRLQAKAPITLRIIVARQ